MAETTCGTCDSTDFELVTLHPAGAAAGILVAQCENCGVPIGVVSSSPISRAVSELRLEVDALRRAIDIG